MESYIREEEQKPLVYIANTETIVSLNIKKFLSIKGYEVKNSFDSKTLLEQIEAKRPDLVIIDYLLERNIREEKRLGLEAAKKIEKKYDITTIILSAYLEQTKKAIEGHLQKSIILSLPFESSKLELVLDYFFNPKITEAHNKLQEKILKAHDIN